MALFFHMQVNSPVTREKTYLFWVSSIPVHIFIRCLQRWKAGTASLSQQKACCHYTYGCGLFARSRRLQL